MKKPPPLRRRLSDEDRYILTLYSGKKVERRPIHAVFLRLNSRHKIFYASRFRDAGYPSAELPPGADWQETHRWCHKTFHDGRGLTYTWTGHLFWFLTESDRAKFLDHVNKKPGA